MHLARSLALGVGGRDVVLLRAHGEAAARCESLLLLLAVVDFPVDGCHREVLGVDHDVALGSIGSLGNLAIFIYLHVLRVGCRDVDVLRADLNLTVGSEGLLFLLRVGNLVVHSLQYDILRPDDHVALGLVLGLADDTMLVLFHPLLASR